MQNSKDDYDKAMQDYAKKWMKSLDRPRYSTNIGTFFILIFLFIWASTLTTQFGYIPMQGSGLFVFLGIGIALGVSCYILNKILAVIVVNKSIRSAIWFSALIGPYLAIVALNNLQNPVFSHIVGVASSLISFFLSFSIDKLFEKRSKLSEENQT